jgi:hypothetical protein
MALLFVANHGSAKTKKYSDPADISHAADMLREALGQVRRGAVGWRVWGAHG